MSLLRIVASTALVVGFVLAPDPAFAWQPNGVAVSDTIGSQRSPVIISDGAGGAVIGWTDLRSTSYDVYAERLRPDGIHEWTSNGVVVCTETGTQDLEAGTTDGAGGAIFVWSDTREGLTPDLFAQRIRANGTAAWLQGGVPVVNVDMATTVLTSVIAPDGGGGAIIAWPDDSNGSFDIRAQRLDGNGNRLWDTTGVLICSTPQSQANPRIVSDGQGGAIIAWEDSRSDTGKIFLQRVDGSGQVLWAANGIQICTFGGVQQQPELASDGGGGAIVAWVDNRDSGVLHVFARKVNAAGAAEWDPAGVQVSAALGQRSEPGIVPDGGGGAILAWRDRRSNNGDIYVQRISASGVIQWGANATAVCVDEQTQRNLKVVPAESGGAIITWEDSRTGVESEDVYAQRVDYAGLIQWSLDGVALSAANGAQTDPVIATDGASGAIVAWTNDGSSRDIYAQRVSHDASDNTNTPPPWQPDGTQVAPPGGIQQNPSAVADGKGGALIAWEDYGMPSSGPGSSSREGVTGPLAPAGPGHARMRAVRVTNTGEGADGWAAAGEELSTFNSDQFDPETVGDGQSGAIVVWKDNRFGNFDIFAQRVLEDGSIAPGWAAAGRGVCTASGDQQHPVAVSDGAGGVIVCWEDRRNGTDYDVRAVRITAGSALASGWLVNGIAICTAAGDQLTPVITADGHGGAIISWSDLRSGQARVYFQHVTASGAILEVADGQALTDVGVPQVEPAIAPDGRGGAFITWTDSRLGNADIFGQHVDYPGSRTWSTSGQAFCTTSGNQGRPAMVSNGAGTALIIWEDQRSFGTTATDLYATSVALDLSVPAGWVPNGNPVCTAAADQLFPQLVPDGAGGAYATWVDMRNGGNDIWAMQITSAGGASPGWPANGFPVSTANGSQEFPRLVTDGSGGAIVAWTDGRIVEPGIYAMHLFGPASRSPTAVPGPSEVSGALRLTLVPNPARRLVAIGFELPAAGVVEVEVLDVTGRRIRALGRGTTLVAGRHGWSWEGRDDAGRPVGSGLYFVRVRGAGIEAVRRLVLLK